MSVNVALVLAVGVLFGTGAFLLMERSLTRVLLGFLLLGNGTNLLILQMGGADGVAPILGPGVTFAEMNDPLPQALILTAIVITFGLTAFVLAIVYRSWWLAREDLVADDVADRLVAEGVVGEDEDAQAPAAPESSSEFTGRGARG